MKKIAVIGSNMIDLVSYVQCFPQVGETIEAARFELGFGGKGANQGVAAANLGADVLMVSKVGSDMFGPHTIKNFKKMGIDTKHVEVMEGSSGVAPIFVEESGQNSIFIIKGANGKLQPKDIDDALEDLRKCHLILLQFEIPLETIYHAIEIGQRENIPVLLNPAPAVPMLNMEIISKVSILVPNETELAIMTDKPVNTLQEIEHAAKSLLTRGIKTVIVTIGAKGAMLVTNSIVKQVPCPQVEAIDTTGAGDAFIGCFARFYSEEGDMVASIERAVAYASLSTTKSGTQKSYSSHKEFEIFLGSLHEGHAGGYIMY